MEKNRQWIENLTAAQQKEFITELEAKLSYYQQLNESPEIWTPLSPESNSSDYVTAIPMEQLL